MSFIHIFLEQTTKNTFVGSLLAPTTLFVNAFAVFNLPKEMHQITPLIPALKSNWLMMHVTIMLLSYAALLSGSLLSISFLFLNWIQGLTTNKLTASEMAIQNANIQSTNLLLTFFKYPKNLNVTSSSIFKKFDFRQNLDNLSYRLIGIGFAFLTIGILSGAVWANEAWGSYWSWDPKETWALITWITFAVYLHTRLVKGWQGEKPALVASFGFIILWICYLGVNLLGKGLHSYGWFT